MNRLSDEELIEELQSRFSANKKSLGELSELTRQLQQVNEKLKDSEKLKSQFLSNIRNEMNNPLSAIIGLSKNILLVEKQTVEKAQYMAALIHAEAFNLDFQLRNIFAAAELESGESFPEVASMCILPLIQSVIDMHQHKIAAKQLFIHLVHGLDKSGSQDFFKTDPAKLQLIISNLLSNAIEYSYANKELYMKIWKEEERLYISIQDFGIGIALSDQENIFNRFTQLHTGMTKAYRGHGLGLSVTKALVELLNGSIKLQSSLNEGSIFTIAIPELTDHTHSNHFATDGNELFFDAERF